MNKFWYSLGIFLLGVSCFLFSSKVLAVEDYSAQWMAQAQKVSMKSGETRSVWIEIKNTGTVSWSSLSDNTIKLGTARRRDRSSNFHTESWISSNRLTSFEKEIIAPGEIANFVFEVTANLPAGNHKEYFGLVAEGITWFDNFDFFVEIEVLPTILSGELATVSDKSIVLKTGESKEISVQIKNTGDVEWSNSSASAVKIGTVGPLDRQSVFYDHNWLSGNRAVVSETKISPNGVGRFNFNIVAPKKTGNYIEKFGVVVEGLAWLEGVEFQLNIKVEPAIYSASFVTKSKDPVITPGEEAIMWVDLRNEGNTIWLNTGDRTAKLGTAEPLDGESKFNHETWLSSNRITMVDKETNPGEVGRFTFTIKAPEQIGTYIEKVRPVIEYVAWMEDLDIEWEIIVNEELVLIDPIRVGLSAATESMVVNSSRGMVIRKGSNKDLVARITSNQSVNVLPIANGYQVKVGGEIYTIKDYIRFIPLKDSILTLTNSQISNYYDRFRGIIIIRRSALSGRVWMVNELELEEYLKGIAEVPNAWPLEARKAQVVAARTFAMRRIATPKADIFDIYDDTRDQVYYGYNYEIAKPGITQAVIATNGIVVTYAGQPALTYYHSDSGGATDTVKNVWDGNNIPYLQSVNDPWAKSTVWEATLTHAYMQDRFDDQLRKVNAVSEVIVDLIIDSRYSSGRIESITLVTSTGKRVSMNTATFDYLTDSRHVKSMNFDVTKTGSTVAPDFTLKGQGNGHGLGMSQWSAYNMANAGQTYDQILKFFYSGVDISVV